MPLFSGVSFTETSCPNLDRPKPLTLCLWKSLDPIKLFFNLIVINLSTISYPLPSLLATRAGDSISLKAFKVALTTLTGVVDP